MKEGVSTDQAIGEEEIQPSASWYFFAHLTPRGGGSLPRVTREDESRSLASSERCEEMDDCLWCGVRRGHWERWVIRYPLLKFWNFHLGGVDYDLLPRWKLCQGAFRVLQRKSSEISPLSCLPRPYRPLWTHVMHESEQARTRPKLHVVLRASRWRGWGRDNYPIRAARRCFWPRERGIPLGSAIRGIRYRSSCNIPGR